MIFFVMLHAQVRGLDSGQVREVGSEFLVRIIPKDREVFTHYIQGLLCECIHHVTIYTSCVYVYKSNNYICIHTTGAQSSKTICLVSSTGISMEFPHLN